MEGSAILSSSEVSGKFKTAFCVEGDMMNVTELM